MKKKIIRREQQSFDFLLTADVPPVLKRIYALRGVQSVNEIECSLQQLLPYHDLSGIQEAASLLAQTIREGKSILIVGDFDADGATSTAVAMRALKSFGAKQINYLVPNRFTYGYGLTVELAELAKQEFNPDLIVTVDNGIANNAGVSKAKELGMKVIITDHHLPGDELPAADVIVNPNQPGDKFPSKNLAGVGVIFYVMLALRRFLSEMNWFNEKGIPEPNMSRLLDIVALGTVADVVALDHNNRVLVRQGLRRIRALQCVPGITALLAVAGRNQQRLVSADLGFAVGPRLNAAGRLEDMSLGIECLLTDDMQAAQMMAERLNLLNDERKVIEQDMQEQALDILQYLKPKNENIIPKGICLFEEDWHQGVIGIVASRIKEKFHRPVIAFALANEEEIKGSGRSIPGLHLRDVLAVVAAKHPSLINKFGGHAMAAGLTLQRHNFTKFAEIFDEMVAGILTEDQLQNCLVSDGELNQDEITLDVAEVLREAGPWGQAFPEPMFDGTFRILEQRIVGSKHLKMVLDKEGNAVDAIAFNINIEEWPNHRCQRVHIAYRMDINEFRGKRSVQLIVEHVEAV